MKIHFIGIGGIGISALARIFHEQGHEVSGSDENQTALTDDLENLGIHFIRGQDEDNVPDDVDRVIYTEAIPEDNLEFQKAQKLGVSLLTYFQALGEFSRDYQLIAIAGTHGKTTTTAMTALGLIEGDIDPNVIIGTKVSEFGNKNIRHGKSDYLVVEACEYRESFLNLNPQILVITNIEAEHLDYYKTEENYLEAFRKLSQKVPKNGYIVTIEGDENVDKILEGVEAQVIKLDTKEGKFTLNQKEYTLPKLQVPGDHYKIDASLAMSVGILLDVEEDKFQTALEKFNGTWRRFERKGEKNGVIVIDDYAHHPTEVQATLRGAREMFGNKKIICIFQPHQYSRTRILFNKFVQSFADCDEVIIPNIYRVRDTKEDVASVSAEELVNAINEHSANAIFSNGFENAVKSLYEKLNPGDVLITMGAGPVHSIGEIYLGE